MPSSSIALLAIHTLFSHYYVDVPWASIQETFRLLENDALQTAHWRLQLSYVSMPLTRSSVDLTQGLDESSGVKCEHRAITINIGGLVCRRF
ncbi:hypothetical protein B0H13DRAFT_2323149 [Mycena leptocephala]|nr:hypothetical protein B0H13DRAFT_2323149 [Mycena leptocephala]